MRYLIIGLIIITFWIMLITFVPADELQAGFEAIWTTIQISLFVAIVGGIIWLGWLGITHGIILHSQARITKAEADGKELQANLIITTAQPGMQVYASETGRLKNLIHKPLYLAPGSVNGKEIVYTQEQERKWFVFNLLQNISHKPDVKQLDNLVTIEQPLPDHVDLSHYLMGSASLHSIFLGVGRYPDGQVKPVSAPLERLVHIAEAGSSGFGKSTHMQALAYQCLNAREAAQTVLLDAQGVTFTVFTGNERLKYGIASQEVDILAILLDLVGEMTRRQELFSKWQGVANLAQYNQAVTEAERLPQIPVFFDEFGLVADNKKIAGQVGKLAKGSRKSGIALICSAQTWGSDEIATSLRANLSTSIQFYSRDKSTSRILLGDSSAANITRPGQAFCRLPGQPGLVELQAADPSNLIEVTPMLLTPGDMPDMPVIEDDQRLVEFGRLVTNGMSRFDASLQVYGKKYSGEHAMNLKRYLSSLSFSSESPKIDVFTENDENES